jgi:hypothetical protein
LLFELRNTVTRLKRDVADAKQGWHDLHNSFWKQLEEKKEEIWEKQKQLDAKDLDLQLLAARKTSGKMQSSSVFIFVLGAVFGVSLMSVKWETHA